MANIVKAGCERAGMSSMTARSVRGVSPSKIVQIFPDLEPTAIKLGRWTNSKTFRSHYQSPVDLVTDQRPPASMRSNPQQILRWGFRPQPPPGLSAEEYMRPPSHWISKSFPRFGRVLRFSDGLYTVQRGRQNEEFYHYELMSEISRSRQSH